MRTTVSFREARGARMRLIIWSRSFRGPDLHRLEEFVKIALLVLNHLLRTDHFEEPDIAFNHAHHQQHAAIGFFRRAGAGEIKESGWFAGKSRRPAGLIVDLCDRLEPHLRPPAVDVVEQFAEAFAGKF